MSRSRLEGAGRIRRLFRRLPDDAREEMGNVLDGVGQELAADMRGSVPVRTGALQRAITYKLLRRSLRLKVGLIGRAINRRLFYARIVEHGRKAQIVTVHRRKVGVNSGLSGGKKKAQDIATIYSLPVKAMAPRPFVFKSRRNLRAMMGTRIRGMWERVLKRSIAGAGAGG